MVQRFYWLIDHGIAGSSRPGSRDRADERVTLEEDLLWLRQHDISAILSLTETPLDEHAVTHHGLEALHLPVPDMTAPLPGQFQHALNFIDLQRSMGRAVVVHCLVGQGRTATILAAYLIRGGVPPHDAIAQLRRLCPGAIGSAEQERALHAFAARQDWIL